MSHPLLQGSVLQIQGPRGYKGSKGDLVRALKLFLLGLFSNESLPGENQASRASRASRTDETFPVLSARTLM